jgi:hypothetical protein
MEIIVLHNQSLLDIAIQHTGSVFNAFEIAVANNIAISDDLIPGMLLVIPESIKKNNDILNYYASKKIQPATAITVNPEDPILEGIGFWRIEKDFKIS